jgi:hypothetical protein
VVPEQQQKGDSPAKHEKFLLGGGIIKNGVPFSS